MAQKLFTTFRAAVESFPLGEQKVGLLKPGRYNGYDIMLSQGGLSIELSHSGKINKTDKTGTPDNNFGAIMMPTGVIIHDTDRPILNINPNSGNLNQRVDFIICEQEYLPVQGGTPALYSVIQGPNNGTLPLLPNPEKQIHIGSVTINPNGWQFSDLTYKPVKPPLPGDLTYEELNNIIIQSIPTVPDATTTVKGKAMLATFIDVEAGSNGDKIVTPNTLYSLTATLYRRGLARFASISEVIEGTREDLIVSPSTLNGLISTETSRGISEIATNNEVLQGTDDERYVTPKKLKDNIITLTLKKEIIQANKTLTASDNGKVIITGGTGSTLFVTVPTGLPNDFHVGFIYGTRSVRIQGANGVNINLQPNKQPEPSSQYTGILLESANDSVNYYLIGNLKSI